MSRARFTIAALTVVAACGVDETVLRKLETAATVVTPAGDASIDSAPSTVVLPPNASDVYDVALGQSFSCAIARGLGFCWGDNLQGALGTGNTQDRLVPAAVAGGHVFDAISGGENHACGLERESGRVLCWGYGARGQLGQGDKTTRLEPTAVSLSGPAAMISAGYNHSCAVLRSGELWCWGANDEGQLGLNDTINDVERLAPTRVGDASDWVFVSGGQGNSCGLRKSGAGASLWCWGRNTSSELGLGTGQPGQIRVPTRAGTDEDWKSIDSGQDCSCGITTDGALRCWGAPGGNNLDGSGNTLAVPTAVGTDRDWAKISVDVFATCGITTDNKLRCWGRNIEGQLGTGDIADRATPTEIPGSWSSVSVGRFHTCALTTDRSVRCTGANDTGQLGTNDNERRNVFSPVILPTPVLQ